jgi:4-hydroxybenzoate polyprenyltransferase
MLGQLKGLWRDAWWLVLGLLAASVFMGFAIAPLLGILTPVVMLPVMVYFAIIRYDEQGRDRGDRMS